MSEENIELVRRGIDAWNAFFRDGSDPTARLQEFCHPEVTLEFSRRLIDAEVYRGYEGAQRFLEQLREPWDDFRVEPERFVDAHNKVVVFSRVVGHAKRASLAIDSAVAHICTVEEGKVIRIEYFGDDRDACLASVGLSE